MRKLKTAYVVFLNKGKTQKAILEQTKEEGNVIYGGRSIQKRIGVFSRPTEDYDIFSKKPKKSAVKTEKKLDKLHQDDLFYVKRAIHPGTWKVMSKGRDLKQNTKDDYGVVDYSKFPKPTPKFEVIDGVKYRSLAAEKKAKMKSLRDKEFAFRHKKDREDLNRIKLASGGK